MFKSIRFQKHFFKAIELHTSKPSWRLFLHVLRKNPGHTLTKMYVPETNK